MSTPFSSPAIAPPITPPITELPPDEEWSEADEEAFEEMLCHLYAAREDYESLDSHSTDRRYWI